MNWIRLRNESGRFEWGKQRTRKKRRKSIRGNGVTLFVQSLPSMAQFIKGLSRREIERWIGNMWSEDEWLLSVRRED